MFLIPCSKHQVLTGYLPRLYGTYLVPNFVIIYHKYWVFNLSSLYEPWYLHGSSRFLNLFCRYLEGIYLVPLAYFLSKYLGHNLEFTSYYNQIPLGTRYAPTKNQLHTGTYKVCTFWYLPNTSLQLIGYQAFTL